VRGLEIRLYASEIWAPQASSRGLAILEGVQRRATKFILQHYEFSYLERLRKLNLLPISYWFEIKYLIFFFKCKQGLYDLDISSFVTFSSNRSSRTRSSKDNLLQVNPCKTSLFRNFFLTELSFYGTISLQSFVTVRLFHPLSSSSILTTLLN
jgi:hypothetical protein